MSMRLDAMDEKFASTRPSKLPQRRSARPQVKAHLRTVRPIDNDNAADAALQAREDS